MSDSKYIDRFQVCPAADAGRDLHNMCIELEHVETRLRIAKLHEQANCVREERERLQHLGFSLDRAARDRYYAERRGEEFDGDGRRVGEAKL